jgi:hypothetical protein
VGVASSTAHYGMAGMVAGDEGLFFTCFECSPVSLYSFDTNSVTPLEMTADVNSLITLTADRIYWGGSQGNIYYAAHDGSGLTTFAVAPTSSTLPALAVDDTHVYWMWTNTSTLNGTLYRAPHTDVTATQIQTIADRLDQPAGLAVGTLGVFWSEPTRGEIHFLAADAPAPQP